ncbi:MAG TPA: helix-turn-helix transcriptional regulator [Candidatus Dormibacteraeota bacterium]|nr:helix-turn-helix transcriptional regulator [Candidatus Dormibacteraeota bacterium]
MKNRIKDLRRVKKWTQEELSQRVDVSRQSIVAIETGKYNPSLKLAFKIAQQFDCSIEEVFLFDEGDEDDE